MLIVAVQSELAVAMLACGVGPQLPVDARQDCAWILTDLRHDSKGLAPLQ
jgi:hypothetical protein